MAEALRAAADVRRGVPHHEARDLRIGRVGKLVGRVFDAGPAEEEALGRQGGQAGKDLGDIHGRNLPWAEG